MPKARGNNPSSEGVLDAFLSSGVSSSVFISYTGACFSVLRCAAATEVSEIP